MRISGAVAVVALGLGASACGSSDDTDDGSGLSCGPKELKVSGTVDGVAVALTRPVTSYRFSNKFTEAPGSAPATTAVGTLSLEFNKSILDGGSSPARGTFVDSEGSLSLGNCETGDFVSTLSMDDDGNGLHFTLRSLQHEPYCSGAAAAGELRGCLGFSER